MKDEIREQIENGKVFALDKPAHKVLAKRRFPTPPVDESNYTIWTWSGDDEDQLCDTVDELVEVMESLAPLNAWYIT